MPATVPKIPPGDVARPRYRVCLPGKRGRHLERWKATTLAVGCCPLVVPNLSSMVWGNSASTGVYIKRLIVVNQKIGTAREKPTPCRRQAGLEPWCVSPYG